MGEIDYAKLDVLVLDVDGVLTDGRIILTASGEEIKAFHCRDGAGMRYWKRSGHRLAIITGRGSPAVLARAKELGVDAVRLNVHEKVSAFTEVLAEFGSTDRHAVVIGDDLMDLPLMRRCAFPVAVADAVEEVRQAASYVTSAAGGEGCVREVIELILKKAGKWQAILSRYLPSGREQPR